MKIVFPTIGTDSALVCIHPFKFNEYEINISYALRSQFSKIVIQQLEGQEEQNWLNQLMDVLNKCNHENKTWLTYSLTRFKHSDDFDEVRQILKDDGQLQIATN